MAEVTRMTLGRNHDLRPAAAVNMALALIPDPIHDLVSCEFVIGIDPVFAGIHHFAESSTTGYAYRDLAHCVRDVHQLHRPRSHRGTKGVLPTNPAYHWDTWDGVKVVVHELGHVLHERTDFDHIAEPVTNYAQTNHEEAFAEAFAAWVWGERIDDHTKALFDGLVV